MPLLMRKTSSATTMGTGVILMSGSHAEHIRYDLSMVGNRL
ncbi:hypothetical protein C357_00654 [Citreicella sp. 357]|nr:hypothetical protein C357_00654 [Citreicella sp. 357]